MDSAVIATAITAIAGVIAAWVTAHRHRVQDTESRKLEANVALIEGYSQIVKDLQIEMARVRSDYKEDIDRIEREKQALQKRIDELDAEVAKLKKLIRG